MSHLSLLLDLQPAAWHDPTQSLQFSTFLAHILVFLNAHLAQKHENSLAIFGAFPGKSIMLYSSIDQTKPADRRVQPDPNWYQPFKTLDAALTERIREEMPQPSTSSEAEELPVALVGALAKALCCKIIQATKVEAPSDTPVVMPESRILIVSVSPDAAASYIPLMNSIFSAQKLKVVIDVCKIYGPDTTFLQQAAYLTGGSYIRVEKHESLLQYLMMCFLQPPSVRSLLAVPTTDRVDFRAACFCHKDIIDAGYVCSVCLSSGSDCF
ncbi:transcription factor Tfb4 [Sistotremastrum suecicum HHB10207 ss-3]|uniref:General transcription and DNA repair factor IIH subunit TFB4 n=1 Tax=Sistotremastrum suecicum HHB10207 ss-3 TaxID=1314776 RepID=A0A166H8L3_9AGAM|nr:transcription factor Tfb4 [Sistotremastrum suecicum HHB10207 ss-3]